MKRNPVSDLRAVIGSPVTAAMAEVFNDHRVATRLTASHPFGLATFMAASWSSDSANRADGMLLELGTEWFIDEAARAGVPAVRAIPTKSQFDHAIAQGGDELLRDLQLAFIVATAELAPQVGLLNESCDNLLVPKRERFMQADGTVFRPYSEVYEEEVDGKKQVVGSKARNPDKARVSQRHHGKKGGVAVGTPAIVLSAHGGLEGQRLVTYIHVFGDYAEQTSAIEGVDVLSGVYGSRLQGINYDRLLDGAALQEIAREFGVPAIVEMKEPQTNHKGVPIPVAHQRPRGDRVKTRARHGILAEVSHDVGGRRCEHTLHGLDGALRITRPGTLATFEDPIAEMIRFERVGSRGAWTLPATYLIPCASGGFEWSTDFTGDLKKGTPMLQRLRPYPEAHAHYEIWHGWRNNIEGVMSTSKIRLPNRRATSWVPARFQLRLLGAAVTINAIAWDIHAAQHTVVGQLAYDRLGRATTPDA